MPTIISIGSAVKDVFIVPTGFKVLKSSQFDSKAGICFAQGGKFEVSQIIYDSGGGATNAAATFRNLGVSCGVCTKVGVDAPGDEIYKEMKGRGVELMNFLRSKNLGTGYSTVIMSPNGDRSILTYRGASSEFNPKDITASKLKAKWFYLTSTKGNIPFVKKVFDIAQKNSTLVFWNPGKGEIKLGVKKLHPFLMQTEILSVNKEEAQMLVKKGDVKNNMKELTKLSSMVFITDGKKGAYFGKGDEMYFIPSTGTAPINTTGAGDSFGSGFLAAYVLSNDWKQAAKVATWNADGVIQEMGAKHGLITKFPTKAQMNKIKIKAL